MSNNVVWHSHPVDRKTRAGQKSQKPLVIWFTGLSASGKSTIAGIDNPYETPQAPEVHIDAQALTVAESVNRLLEFLHQSGVLKAGYAPISISA